MHLIDKPELVNPEEAIKAHPPDTAHKKASLARAFWQNRELKHQTAPQHPPSFPQPPDLKHLAHKSSPPDPPRSHLTGPEGELGGAAHLPRELAKSTPSCRET